MFSFNFPCGTIPGHTKITNTLRQCFTQEFRGYQSRVKRTIGFAYMRVVGYIPVGSAKQHLAAVLEKGCSFIREGISYPCSHAYPLLTHSAFMLGSRSASISESSCGSSNQLPGYLALSNDDHVGDDLQNGVLYIETSETVYGFEVQTTWRWVRTLCFY